ncbi:hypothetical protein SLS62_002744 [Diatrype stigma]|uniref:Uncharacterized protein n=1 Tax=Diatrype stigma TaxID=117547 RepID=A0AAN9YUW2_9PEZI
MAERAADARVPPFQEGAALSGQSEVKLNTHDVALTLPLPPTAAAPLPRVLRAIFLAPKDVGTEATRARLERLYHLNGGKDVVVVFLLEHEAGQEQSPVAALMMLQQE